MTSHPSPVTRQQRLVLVGSQGMLAQKVAQQAAQDWLVTGVDLPEFDLTNAEQVMASLRALRPELIINCAAFTDVDGCEAVEAAAALVNGAAAGLLAELAKELGATLVHISTDYVFAGEKNAPYLETDAPNPRSAYGRTKLAGERAILESGLEKFFIIRTGWLYGPGGKNFVETIIRLATERSELRIVADQLGTPTYTGDLAAAIFRLLEVTRCSPQGDAPYGLYHFSNLGQCSWYEFAREIVRLAQAQGLPLQVRKVLPIATADYPLPAPRPAFSVFSKQKYLQTTGASIPEWRTSLKKYMASRSK